MLNGMKVGERGQGRGGKRTTKRRKRRKKRSWGRKDKEGGEGKKVLILSYYVYNFKRN